MTRVLNIVVWGLKLGGLETTVINYYRNIDREKVQFDFLFNSNGTKPHYYEEEALSLGANVYRRPSFRKHPIKNFLTLYRVLKENPDIKIIHIHSNNSFRPSLDLLCAGLVGIKVRIMYSSSSNCKKRPIAHRLFRPFLRRIATHWTAGSTYAGLHMFGKKAIEKLILIPRARDLSAYRYDPERRLIMREKLGLGLFYAIANVATLRSLKNHVFLIDVFANAIRDMPDMILLLAGDGKLRAELEVKVDAMKLKDKVLFLGQRSDIPEILQAADLFVLPSLYEGLPGTAIEAQASGLPCLLSDKIQPEAKVTDLVEFLPIDQGTELWEERIRALKDFKRRDTMEELSGAGYDIHDAAKWLEAFYLSTVKEDYKLRESKN